VTEKFFFNIFSTIQLSKVRIKEKTKNKKEKKEYSILLIQMRSKKQNKSAHKKRSIFELLFLVGIL
jgi:hypothetical protein